jgi:hypothetical protein
MAFFDPELVAFFTQHASAAEREAWRLQQAHQAKRGEVSHAAMLTARAACRKYAPPEEPTETTLRRGPRGGRYYLRSREDGTLRRDYC